MKKNSKVQKTTTQNIFLWAFIFVLCNILSFSAAYAAQNTKKIAYFEQGEFWLFNYTYDALKVALQKRNVTVEYPEALHVSPGWNATTSETEAYAKKLLQSDADIIIAAGTSAVNTLLSISDGNKPIIGIALADPMAAGVMKTPTDSGRDDFNCEVIPNRWKNMYYVFHEIIGFKKLGVMYPEGKEGRIYAAVDDAEAVAAELGFELVHAVIPSETEEDCSKGLDELHQQGADAFFISPLLCFDWSVTDPSALIKKAHAYDMPTFARDGSHFVQGGALMGFATWDFTPTGEKLADTVQAVFAGKSPREVSMLGTSEPVIALNLQVARELGLDISFDLLLAADEIYEITEKPNLR